MKSNRCPPVFVVGCVRSGKTLLRTLLQKLFPNSVSLTDEDRWECRTFWRAFGLRIGARSTGTYCLAAGKEDVREEHRVTIQAHVERRCNRGHLLLNDNAHLMNKIGYVAEALPASRFILVIREVMSLVACQKRGFQRGNVSNESYPASVHYWPDDELPCWYTIRNDCARRRLTLGAVRRLARAGCYWLGLKRRESPSHAVGHEQLSRFCREHPDTSRYYPGGGFARLPEAWLTQNLYAVGQLRMLGDDRWMTVTSRELVSDVRGTLGRIMEWVGIGRSRLDAVPPRLQYVQPDDWQDALSGEEQETVRAVLRQRSSDFDALCQVVGAELLADSAGLQVTSGA